VSVGTWMTCERPMTYRVYVRLTSVRRDGWELTCYQSSGV
jgi:hypothetical protein